MFLLFLAVSTAQAQDRAEDNAAGDWRPAHFQKFDGWESICDERGAGADLHRRCYIRYVDVFSPHPDFGAVVSFITPDGSGYKVEFAFERGVRYREDGFQVERDRSVLWKLSPECRDARPCILRDEAASDFIDMARSGDGALVQRFIGRYGQRQLEWPIAPLKHALVDFEREAAKRDVR